MTGPLGPERADLHAAIVASTIANANSKKKFTPKDFMPEWDRKPQTWEDQLALVKQLNANYGGTVEG